MQYEPKPAFLKSLKKLHPETKQKVKEAIRDLVKLLETGQKSPGLGLKRLRKNYWEIRATIKDRIIFRLSTDLVEFIIVGSHDEIKNFLKNI